MNQTISPIDEIKELYSKVNKKTKFIISLATELGKSPKACRNNWFGEFWIIPSEYHARVKELLEETIKNQENEKAN